MKLCLLCGVVSQPNPSYCTKSGEADAGSLAALPVRVVPLTEVQWLPRQQGSVGEMLGVK